MKIILDLSQNQKVFLLQDETFALNINKRMKAISAEASWCAWEAIRKVFTGGCSCGGCVPRAWHSQPHGRELDPGRAEIAATKSAWLK